jgi:hypothetical protein
MIKLYFEIRREMGCTPAVAWAIAMDMVARGQA